MPRDGKFSDDSSHSTQNSDAPKCCNCRQEVDRQGFCQNCNVWPINVTPVRRDNAGHVCDVGGWCRQCVRFVLTRMEPVSGEWYDSRQVNKLCGKEENQTNARRVAGTLSGPGWPEKEVPLNERFTPRRWSRAKLRVVGETQNGDKVLFPSSEKLQTIDSEVPF